MNELTDLIASIKQTLYLTRSVIRKKTIPVLEEFTLVVELIRFQNQSTDALLLLENYFQNQTEQPHLK